MLAGLAASLALLVLALVLIGDDRGGHAPPAETVDTPSRSVEETVEAPRRARSPGSPEAAVPEETSEEDEDADPVQGRVKNADTGEPFDGAAIDSTRNVVVVLRGLSKLPLQCFERPLAQIGPRLDSKRQHFRLGNPAHAVKLSHRQLCDERLALLG